MKIQSVKGVLLAITTSMVAGLVLMPQVAFSQEIIGNPVGPPVLIDTYHNACKFRDIDGGYTTVYSPDYIKVVQRGHHPPRGTCEDASITTEEGQSQYYEGYAHSINSCSIKVDDSPKLYSGEYKQTIDENGAKLTCVGAEPRPLTCKGNKHYGCGAAD